MAIGGLLGLLGMVLTRWESHPEGFFYTPSRWLALLVMLAIAARLIYGWWHTMHRSAASDQHWLWSASGTQLSVAVAAGLIGYYLVYAIGVRIRITRYEKRRHD
jgi:ABC-type Fe3+ transport system permease subunit